MGFNRYTFYNYSKYYSVLLKFFTYKILACVVCDNINLVYL